MDLQMYGLIEVSPEFIAKKIRESNWFDVNGDINALNDTIEYVPAANKRAHLYEAKIVTTGHTTPANSTGESFNQVEADLLIDSVVEDTTNIGWAARGTTSAVPTQYPAFGNIGDGRFNVAGKYLDGNGVKKIEIKNVDDDGSAHASMSGWLEDI